MPSVVLLAVVIPVFLTILGLAFLTTREKKTTTAAAVAATTAVSAYLDAKLHLTKDIKTIWNTKAAEWASQKAGKENRNSLWYFFEIQVNRLPASELCIWSRSGCYTWQQTHQQSCRYAQFLLNQGLQPGELVGFYLQNSPEFIFCTLGSWSVGSAPALINYNLGGDGLIHCLRISGTKLLLVDEDQGCRERIEESRGRIEGELGIKIVILDQTTKASINALEPKRPEQKYRENVKPDFPMCLLYTSGSTGLPKACPFQIARAHVLAGPRVRAVGLEPGPNGDRWYNCMPLYHGTGFTTAVTCMISGLTLCIGKKFSTSKFWDDIRDSDSTAFVYVGETARYLLANPVSELDKKHRVKVMFGNGLRPDVWRRFTERFGVPCVSEFFNSTEGVFSLLNVSRGPYLQSAVGHHGFLLRSLLHNIYVPVEIDHATGEIYRDPVTGFARRKPYEEGGEMIVAVPDESAFVGYWQNEKATKSKFERDVFKKGDLYYRSGDALRRTKDGRWFFMDRLGDTFRWKSENVSTAEVAEALGHFPGVEEAIVYGVEVPGHDGRAGCAALYISPDQRDKFDYAALLAYARKKLPKYAVPVFLRILNSQEGMHNNKQNKVPLKKEGINLKLIEEAAKEKGVQPDRMMWCPYVLGTPRPEGVGEKEGYVEFKWADWEGLRADAHGETASKL
ncbi:hypothetical protein H2201_005773 [Coniosporium apollinis]|uniref:AMP-dependent synthetase/ligase domain-containing protein n=1 Tax=Coniosporium apollinis TaxID=61459 RepID=A0ABQ9NQZ2_9PEZI|nr:hypothetical protein H2201_005773 [Coniosporium apollinis]